MQTKIGSGISPLVLSPTRRRQTPRPSATFRRVMENGAQILLAGAKVATRLVGGPFLSAAIPKTGADTTGPDTTSPDTETREDLMKNLQSENRLSEDMKLLALQEKIQRDNRKIALVSNVMKARHDTAKSAIANIRS